MRKPDDHIEYKGTLYPAWKVNVNGEEVLFSTTALERRLFTSSGRYRDREAEAIDAQVGYYISDGESEKAAVKTYLS